ncbi:hypothetical protein [Nocardioides pelophilus]|uniref:hypothetical protein n=1 Tax=Nocardioides pelophilus TaxID=2172019 RepID=UPI001601D1C4|nr:hypothetical protein [Nocardioides pelophilus]
MNDTRNDTTNDTRNDTTNDTRNDTDLDDPMLDDEWLAAPAARSRLRAVLVVLLAAAVCFLGGALVQKQLGTDAVGDTAAGAGGFPGGQLPEGLPEGIPENIGQGGFPGDSEDSAGSTADGGDDRGSVIGEVVEVRGDLWIVEDLGGERHEIEVGDDTDVVRETRIEPAQVEVGDPVDITGTSSGGRIKADEVTLR